MREPARAARCRRSLSDSKRQNQRMGKNKTRKGASAAPRAQPRYRLLLILIGVATATAGLLYWHRWSARESERRANNQLRLSECEPGFAADVGHVLRGLELLGLRPWIRESWRSPQDQDRAFRSGRSEIRLGFHNVTGRNGEHRSFAVDIVEGIDQTTTKPGYAVALARLAGSHRLKTGVLWGLMDFERPAVERAIQNPRLPVDRYLKLGWDPCHLEPLNLSLADALARVGATDRAAETDSMTVTTK